MTEQITQEVITCETIVAKKVRIVLNRFTGEMFNYCIADLLRLLQREELSMPRAVALLFLKQTGSASISDISNYLNLSLGNTSHIVDQLVCGGYVTRAEDANDRRLKLVALTPKGRAFIAEVEQVRIEQMTKRLQQMPTPLLEAALTVLTDMLDQLAIGAPSQITDDREN